ncbi:MAG: hypothetical protein RIQ33_852 [Bacteroidota bacterium]
MEKTIENLLSQVKAISKKYEEIAKITGEKFNVFNVLGLTTKEVRTHSAFLAELLNPKGSHGQGDIFLKLFLQIINPNSDIPFLNNFETIRAICKREFHIGNINKDYTEGGRIDILIFDNKGHAIIIENKIYANDQPHQLGRYKTFAKNNYKQGFSILYLNLNGNESNETKDNEFEDYISISYKFTIIDWLELCKKEAVNFPLLRETITQYIYIIKQLTNQSTNHKMSEEILSQIISNKSNFVTSLEIRKAFDLSYDLLLKKLEEQLKEIATDLKLNFNFNLDRSNIYRGFGFYSEIMLKENIKLEYQCQAKNLNQFIFGFNRIDTKTNDNAIRLNLFREDFDRFGQTESNSIWICYANWNEHHNWSESEFVGIIDGTLQEEIKNHVKKLLEFAETKITTPQIPY